MVKLYIGVTDYAWFRFLSALPAVDEVNFWQPGGRTSFKALRPGELFLFKLHSPRDYIVGGGVFARASILPVSLAWSAFGIHNGAASLDEMRRRISFYRREQVDPHRDYMIGCRMLEEPFFLREDAWISVPASWSRNIVSGRTYDTADQEGRRLWTAVTERLAAQPRAPLSAGRYGEPVLIQPRLGQGTFRVAVTDVYQRSCAVTRERTLPILDAAHIRPFAEGGEHDVANGLLLRTDVHRLFDLGYVTVSTDARFEVGRRLRDDFENGRPYYACTVGPSRCRAIRERDRLAKHWSGTRQIVFSGKARGSAQCGKGAT